MIKFRAWNDDTESLFYPHERQAVIACCRVIEVLENYPVYGGKYRTSIVKSFNGKLEQYTEAKDRTKREIYHNDILESGLTKHRYVVVKENGAWIGRSLTSEVLILPFCNFEFSKVIGTVHDEEMTE